MWNVYMAEMVFKAKTLNLLGYVHCPQLMTSGVTPILTETIMYTYRIPGEEVIQQPLPF